jgi:hypothetical protein
MTPLADIYHEYIRMREHGLEVQEALRALRVYVEVLNEGERESLAIYLRAWEKDRQQAASCYFPDEANS